MVARPTAKRNRRRIQPSEGNTFGLHPVGEIPSNIPFILRFYRHFIVTFTFHHLGTHHTVVCSDHRRVCCAPNTVGAVPTLYFSNRSSARCDVCLSIYIPSRALSVHIHTHARLRVTDLSHNTSSTPVCVTRFRFF